MYTLSDIQRAIDTVAGKPESKGLSVRTVGTMVVASLTSSVKPIHTTGKGYPTNLDAIVKKSLSDMSGQEIPDGKVTLEGLCLDSLDIVELVMALEESLDIEIPDETFEKMWHGSKTVADFVAAMKELWG